MKRYIETHRMAGQFYYAVYNSRGQLALWTTNRSMAEQYAREFFKNQHSTEVVILEQRTRSPKRR